jgi:hypothetical protein
MDHAYADGGRARGCVAGGKGPAASIDDQNLVFICLRVGCTTSSFMAALRAFLLLAFALKPVIMCFQARCRCRRIPTSFFVATRLRAHSSFIRPPGAHPRQHAVARSAGHVRRVLRARKDEGCSKLLMTRAHSRARATTLAPRSLAPRSHHGATSEPASVLYGDSNKVCCERETALWCSLRDRIASHAIVDPSVSDIVPRPRSQR